MKTAPVDCFASLRTVLARAADQAAAGKGIERHSSAGEPFEKQQICQFPRWQGSVDAPVFQACKKAMEAKRLPKDRAVAELLGAINYLAAAVIVREELP
jgi:hypothetical protein